MDDTDELMVGLCRTIIRLMVSRVGQRATDRKIVLHALRRFSGAQANDGVGDATGVWVRQVIEALGADPSA